MRRRLILLLTLSLGAVGCSTMSNTEKGAGIGAAIGTGAGLAIGAATGNPKTGALAGGLIGAGTGGLIGHSADENEKKEAAIQQASLAESQPPPPSQLGMSDVVSLTQQGVGDDVLINYIRTSRSRFQLVPSDIAYLHSQKVSDRVITEMMNTSRAAEVSRGPRTVVVREPETVIYERGPYWGRPVYVMPPPPPPPIGVGFHYVRMR